VPVLAEVLSRHLGGRRSGPVFRRRCWADRAGVGGDGCAELDQELVVRGSAWEAKAGQPLSRDQRARLARRLWRERGALREDRVRLEFIRLTRTIGLAGCTAPKLLRHQFATALQEGRVDPLIRNELMGHVPAGARVAGHGLGMTAVYTHTRPEICRQQLEAAL